MVSFPPTSHANPPASLPPPSLHTASFFLAGLVENSQDKIFTECDESRRKCKIICTIGPACWSVETLGALVDAGMNVARLNFSHGDHEGHAATLQRLRQALSTRRGKHVAVMLDTKVG